VVLRCRLAVAGLLVLSLLAAGTIGLHLAEGATYFDAFYQSVVTIATAGVASAQAATTGGKVLTICLLLIGGGVLVYCVGAVAQVTLEGQLIHYFGGQRMRGRIERLSDHYIICGYGRVGEEVAGEFAQRGVEFVVVEIAPEIAARAQERGCLVVQGDATDDLTLFLAGIERARCLIAVSNSDANNTYITLSAKALNPTVYVVARTSTTANDRKLTQAGADRVISPYSIAGRHIALSAIQPAIVDFGATPAESHVGMLLAQIAVDTGSGHTGRTVDEILSGSRNTTALGLRTASGHLVVAPDRALVVNGGDELIVFGPEHELERIAPRPGRGSPETATRGRS
jgi:voltage-gated potassium channel